MFTRTYGRKTRFSSPSDADDLWPSSQSSRGSQALAASQRVSLGCDVLVTGVESSPLFCSDGADLSSKSLQPLSSSQDSFFSDPQAYSQTSRIPAEGLRPAASENLPCKQRKVRTKRQRGLSLEDLDCLGTGFAGRRHRDTGTRQKASTEQKESQGRKAPSKKGGMGPPKDDSPVVSKGKLESIPTATLAVMPAVRMTASASLLEAQECGEIMECIDDAAYALDGLKSSCPLRVQQKSAAKLAALCAASQYRRVLQANGLLETVVDSVLLLRPLRNPSLALSAAAICYFLCQDFSGCLEGSRGGRVMAFLLALLQPCKTCKRQFTGSGQVQVLSTGGCSLCSILQNSTDSGEETTMVKMLFCSDEDSLADPLDISPLWIGLKALEMAACTELLLTSSLDGSLGISGRNQQAFLRAHLENLKGSVLVAEVACHLLHKCWDFSKERKNACDKKRLAVVLYRLMLCSLRVLESLTFMSIPNQDLLTACRVHSALPSSGFAAKPMSDMEGGDFLPCLLQGLGFLSTAAQPALDAVRLNDMEPGQQKHADSKWVDAGPGMDPSSFSVGFTEALVTRKAVGGRSTASGQRRSSSKGKRERAGRKLCKQLTTSRAHSAITKQEVKASSFQEVHIRSCFTAVDNTMHPVEAVRSQDDPGSREQHASSGPCPEAKENAHPAALHVSHAGVPDLFSQESVCSFVTLGEPAQLPNQQHHQHVVLTQESDPVTGRGQDVGNSPRQGELCSLLLGEDVSTLMSLAGGRSGQISLGENVCPSGVGIGDERVAGESQIQMVVEGVSHVFLGSPAVAAAGFCCKDFAEVEHVKLGEDILPSQEINPVSLGEPMAKAQMAGTAASKLYARSDKQSPPASSLSLANGYEDGHPTRAVPQRLGEAEEGRGRPVPVQIETEAQRLAGLCAVAAGKVLMNVTNHNRSGCALVVTVGGMEALSMLLLKCVPAAVQRKAENYSISGPCCRCLGEGARRDNTHSQDKEDCWGFCDPTSQDSLSQAVSEVEVPANKILHSGVDTQTSEDSVAAELVLIILGLLVNVAESSQESRGKLLQCSWQQAAENLGFEHFSCKRVSKPEMLASTNTGNLTGDQGDQTEDCSGRSFLLVVLCDLFLQHEQLEEKNEVEVSPSMTGASALESQEGSLTQLDDKLQDSHAQKLDSFEPTSQTHEQQEDEVPPSEVKMDEVADLAESMIVAAHSAVLLAFLARHSECARYQVEYLLPTKSVSQLVPVLQCFAAFHEGLHAFSSESATNLQDLIEWCLNHKH